MLFQNFATPPSRGTAHAPVATPNLGEPVTALPKSM